MAQGRKRKAPHLRVVDDRADRDTGVRPARADASEIHPPKSMRLSKSEQARFYELVSVMDDAGIASPTYSRLLAQIARREEDIARMRKQIADEYVREVLSTKGELVLKANPLITQMQEAERHLTSLYAAACITPADLTKAVRTKGADPLERGNPFITQSTRT